MKLRIDAPIKPVPFKRVIPRYGRPKNPAEYTEFKNELGYFALKAMNGRELFKGAIKITVDFFKPKPKRSKYFCGDFAVTPDFGDVDNFLKSVLDALNGICYLDDRQVVDAHARKFFGKPRIEITLEELS